MKEEVSIDSYPKIAISEPKRTINSTANYPADEALGQTKLDEAAGRVKVKSLSIWSLKSLENWPKTATAIRRKVSLTCPD